MNDAASATIYRPGTALSRSPQSQSRSIVRQNSKSIRPSTSSSMRMSDTLSLNRPFDPSKDVDILLSSFRRLSSNLMILLSHNCASMQIRDQLSSSFRNLESNFQAFYVEELAHKSLHPQMSPTVLTYFSSLTKLSESFQEFSFNGHNILQESFSSNFSGILSIIDSVQQSNPSPLGVHDQIYKKCRQLQSQLQAINESLTDKSGKFNATNQEKTVVEEIRSFSRAINSAFSTEFSRSRPVTSVEAQRSQAYTSCCNIIRLIKESNQIEADSANLDGSIEELKSSTLSFLESTGRSLKEPEKPHKKEDQPVVFDAASLSELIAKGREMNAKGSFSKESIDNFLNSVDGFNQKFNDTLKSQTEKVGQLKEEIEKEKFKVNDQISQNQTLADENRVLKQKVAEVKEDSRNQKADSLRDELKRSLKEMGDAIGRDGRLSPELAEDLIAKHKEFEAELFGKYNREKQEIVREKEASIRSVVNEREASVHDLSEKVEILSKQIVSFTKGFTEILALFSKEKADNLPSYTFSVVDDQLKSMKSKFASEIEEKNAFMREYTSNIINRLRRLVGSQQNDSVESLLSEIEKNLSEKETNILKLQKSLRDIRFAMESALSTTLSEPSDAKAILAIIPKIPKPANDEQRIKQMLVSLRSLNTSAPLPPQSDPYNEASQLIEKLGDNLQETSRENRKQSMDFIKTRAAIELVYTKLAAFLHLEASQLHDLEISDLLERILKAIDKIVAPSIEHSALKKADIDGCLTQIFQCDGSFSREDPNVYLKELSQNYVVLFQSVQALKEFTDILDNLFQNFDCQFSSFDPSSPQFSNIREHVSALHSALNRIAPNKIHSLVFLLLSRFITLISSFMSAIASKSLTQPN